MRPAGRVAGHEGSCWRLLLRTHTTCPVTAFPNQPSRPVGFSVLKFGSRIEHVISSAPIAKGRLKLLKKKNNYD